MKAGFLLIALFLLTGCAFLPGRLQASEPSVLPRGQAIYIVSHDWHTGFVIPAKTIQVNLPQLKERFPDAAYLEFGWGEQDFYQADEISTGLTLKALFCSAGTVLHVAAIPQRFEAYFANNQVEKLCVTAPAYASLIRFISDSFYKSSRGEIVALKHGLYGNSQFYAAVGDYGLLNTCNSWTAKGLESAGMDINPDFKLTAESVMTYLQEYKSSLSQNASPDLTSLCNF